METIDPVSVGVFPGPEEPDLVAGTRIVVQSLPPPLNGRCGKVVDFDRASQAYVVHVDGGNPRTLYRENLRILEDQSVPVVPVKRAAPRPLSAERAPRLPAREVGAGGGSQIKPGDQVLLCVEQHQFTLMEVTGLRRVCKSEPHSFAIAAVLDDADVPAWMRKPPPQPAAKSKSGTAGGFRIGDPVYAVWDQDGRWYPGRVREDVGGDKFEIEWVDKEALPSLAKKSLVCKRTAFDDLRNRPNYVAALNLASRTGGMKGLKAQQTYADEDDETGRTEETRAKSAAAAADLFGAKPAGTEMTQDEWNTVLQAMRVLSRFHVDGLVSSKRGEVFHVPAKLVKDADMKPAGVPVVQGEPNWDIDSSSSLHAWLTEGQVVKTSLTLPPVSTSPAAQLTAPSRAALEASLSKAWPGRSHLTLPRGPLDIFHPPTKSE